MANDPVEAVIEAFLDHLESDTPAPTLDHLSAEDRARAEELMALMREGRGIDVYQSRPSLNTLLAGTEFEGWLDPPQTEGLSLDAIRDDVTAVFDSAPIVDGAAEYEGINSNAVARCGAHRIRFQFRDDLTSVFDLGNIDPQVAVGPVFGRFPETAIVIVITGDTVQSSVAIDLYDTEPYIGSPDGEVHPPRLSRPILPLRDTLHLLVGEFTTTVGNDDVVPQGQHAEIDDIVDEESHAACATIAAEGRRARTEAKKEAWTGFDATPWLNDLAVSASIGDLTDDDFEAQLTAQAAAA
jgi:hypothetical protein